MRHLRWPRRHLEMTWKEYHMPLGASEITWGRLGWPCRHLWLPGGEGGAPVKALEADEIEGT